MRMRLFVGLLVIIILLSGGIVWATEISSIVDTPGTATDVSVDGIYAYVADGTGGLRVIDVNDPTLPWEVGSLPTPGTASGIAIYGNYALIADGVSGLQVYDLSDPLNPQPFANIPISGSASDVFVVGQYAYVAAGSGGLQIVSLHNILAPYLVISYDTPGEAIGVVVYDDLAYLADGSAGLQMIDVGDPTFPTVIGAYPVPETTQWISVAGDIVFVASSEGLMSVYRIDASDPSDPQLIERQAPSGSPRSVAVADNLAYVADLENGLKIISLGKHLPGKIFYPNGDETFTAEQSVQVVWSPLSTASSYEVYFSYGDGTEWTLLGSVTDVTTYSWQVPDVTTAQLNCRLRVKAFNGIGGLVGDDISDNPFAITFSAGSPGTLDTPASNDSGTFRVSWTGSTEPGVTYVLEMSKDGAPYVEIYRGSNTYFDVAGLYDGSYSFRVKTIKDGYLDSVWSLVGTTAVVNPQSMKIVIIMLDDLLIPIPIPEETEDPVCAMPTGLTAPVFNYTEIVNVGWNGSSTWGADYVLEMSSDAGVSYVQVYGGGNLSAAIPVPGAGSYRFRVKAVHDGKVDSSWAVSGATLVTLGAPDVLTVQPTSDDGNIAISWTASASSGVEYVVDMSSAGGVSIAEVYRGTGLSATVTVSANDSYSFRVKAIKSGYSDTAWVPGNACVVELACQPLASISAVANDAAGTVAVSWAATTTAGATYVLEMSADAGLNYSQVYAGAMTAATITPPAPDYYRFRVKAVKVGFVDSVWTVGTDVPFQKVADAVVVSAPISDTDGSYTVSWGASQFSGATYVLEEALDSSFTTGLRTVASYVSATSVSISSRADYSTYYYRVRVSVPGMVDGAWSNVDSTQIVYPTLPEFRITSPSLIQFACFDGWQNYAWSPYSGSFPIGTLFDVFIGAGLYKTVSVPSVWIVMPDSRQISVIVTARKTGYRSRSAGTVATCVYK